MIGPLNKEQLEKLRYYCPKCDTENITKLCPRCDVNMGKQVSRQDNIYAKLIWNEAIEAAAKLLEADHWQTVPSIIRELKK